MGASKWFMHNGHNTGQKIQKSAIFSTYLPNLEALCTRSHEWAIGPLRQLPQPPAPILSKLKFFPTFLLFFTHCGMYEASFSLESRHWWGAYQMSPIMSKSMKVTSGGSEHSIVGKWRHVKFRKKALPEIWCWILFLMIIFAVKSVISCILFNKDFVSVFFWSLFLWPRSSNKRK